MRAPKNLTNVRLRRRLAAACPVPRTIEALEARTFLSATLTAAIDPQQLAPGTQSTPIDLDLHFHDPVITGLAAVIDTSEGFIPLNLFSQQAPKTVNNFTQYAANGTYNGTVIQRTVPGFLLQGGGFTSDQSHIFTTTPVVNEFSVSNTLGTISAALNTDPNTQQVDPNSATTDWFINDGNNTSLDAQKFTVFGQVIYNGMQVVDQIEALPKGAVSPAFEPNVNAGDLPGGVLPLRNYNNGSPIRPANYVYTNSIANIRPLLYSVTSDNPSLLTGTVNGATLTLTAGQGNGVAHVTVSASDLGSGIVNTTFDVQVGQTQVALGKGQAKLVKFTDPDGTASQIAFAGAGTATVSFGGLGLTSTPGKGGIITLAGTPASVTVAVTASGPSSALNITGQGGNGVVDVLSITADGPMRSINGRNTALTGNLVTGGAVANLTLASLTGGNATLNGPGTSNVSIGTVNNASVASTGAIKSLSSNSWNAGGTISGKAIGKIAIKGDFLGLVSATSMQSFTAGSIAGGTFNVTGNLGALTTQSISSWNAGVGSLGKLNVKAAMDSSALRSTGNISSVIVGDLTNSLIFAGVSSIGLLPATAADFVANTTIKLIKLNNLTASSLAAKALTNVNLGTSTPTNNSSPFGVAAHQVKSLTANIGGKSLKLKNVTTPAQVTTAYTAAGIIDSDPEVRIV